MSKSDKDLADRIVALGIGEYHYDCYYLYRPEQAIPADIFVRDWRVAGALMEKLPDGLLIWQQHYPDLAGMKVQPVWIVEPPADNTDGRDESLPRAICEACVMALESEND